MRDVKIGVVLDTMWGDDGFSPPWFVINPENFSGKRLYKLTGLKQVWVTNVCREQVSRSTIHGKPDPYWLAQNLQLVRYSLLLVCGNRPWKCYQYCPYTPPCPVLCMPHPAARIWTKQMLVDCKDKIRSMYESARGEQADSHREVSVLDT